LVVILIERACQGIEHPKYLTSTADVRPDVIYECPQGNSKIVPSKPQIFELLGRSRERIPFQVSVITVRHLVDLRTSAATVRFGDVN